MLYKKNQTEKLDMNLFQNPTAEYRGTPFWAWNCKLEAEELTRQVCSPGGTTLAALTAFDERNFDGLMMDAMTRCLLRARELGK